MGRRQSREAVLKSLYQIDVGGASPERAMADALAFTGLTPEDSVFMSELVLGAMEHLTEIDRIIASLSKDWNIDRLARVDHNIMRMAVYEIIYRDDIPFGVTVNEAVELAKKYGGEESGKFVNGVLGQVIHKTGDIPVNPEDGSATVLEGGS